MKTRALFAGSAALLALTGCGGSAGTSVEPATTGSAATGATTPGPTATESSAPGTVYGPRDRAVTVAPGEEFALTLPADPGLGQDWYLTDPEPAAGVLKYRGKRKDYADSQADGATGGTQSFDFTALAEGTATVRLLWCPMNTCGGPDDTASPSPFPTATGTPGAAAAFYVFQVTVR